jgi:ABC-type transport system involved in multi-copper enzyme maturation permease subunit
MRKVFVIAMTTLRELFREKIFYIIFFAGVVVIALSLLFGAMSFDERTKMLIDFGYAAAQLSLLCLSVFLGSSLLSKEIEKQTCLLVLSRPVSREQFLLGKFMGVFFLLLITGIFMNAIILTLLADASYFVHSWLVTLSLILENSVILGFVFFLSTFVRPVIAMLGGFSLFFLGHWLPDMIFFAKKSQNPSMLSLAETLLWIIPQFFQFNWKTYFFFQSQFNFSEVLLMVGHCVSWMTIALLLSLLLIRKKDIV